MAQKNEVTGDVADKERELNSEDSDAGGLLGSWDEA